MRCSKGLSRLLRCGCKLSHRFPLRCANHVPAGKLVKEGRLYINTESCDESLKVEVQSLTANQLYVAGFFRLNQSSLCRIGIWPGGLFCCWMSYIMPGPVFFAQLPAPPMSCLLEHLMISLSLTWTNWSSYNLSQLQRVCLGSITRHLEAWPSKKRHAITILQSIRYERKPERDSDLHHHSSDSPA